jgi:hypothetical protein
MWRNWQIILMPVLACICSGFK